MSVPIALCASPPSGVCSTPHPCQINSHSSSDYELNHRSGSATVQKPAIVGGLSCLFSSPSVKHASTNFVADELSSRRHGCSSLERGEDLCSSFCYSSIGSSIKGNRDQSPVSVFQGPVSCSSVGSRSPPVRITREQNPFRVNRDGFINGFFRNALGSSCFDYDSPIFPMPGGSSLRHDDSLTVEEEFTFNLEDTFIETNRNSCVEKDQSGYLGSYNLELYARSMLSGAQSRHKIFSEEFIVKAFCEAEKAHRGQMRASGDPYLQHCVETAVFLAAIGADTIVVAAGLLHDTLDDTFMDYDYILQAFGVGVADLVEGVSKLSQLSKLARENNTASKTVEADRLHTMFLAMADARAVLIKLADRLHNMLTLEALPLPKQQRFAKETLEIFSPLANRLGISTWKEQLENLCFKHLNPLKHHELASKLIDPSREAKITSAIEKLDRALKNESVPYHVLSGRHKSLYSIFSKMSKKKLSMDEIHDIHGLRLIVENEDDCYRALRIVHHMWPQVQGKLKDYIAHPKFNGYRSLHTVVLGEDMVPLEIQIRTREMHLQAEFGFAAHWRYKEGECKHSSFILQMVEWARWVVTWQCETVSKDHHRSSSLGTDSIRPPCPFPSHSEDCPYSYLPHCNQDGPVFVIMMENEKMSVQEFAANSTVRDLLERVGRESSRWSSYSRVLPVKEELRPRLNHLPVSDTSQKLKMGDVVELTPAIPDKALTECREEIQRMFDRDLNIAVPS